MSNHDGPRSEDKPIRSNYATVRALSSECRELTAQVAVLTRHKEELTRERDECLDLATKNRARAEAAEARADLAGAALANGSLQVVIDLQAERDRLAAEKQRLTEQTAAQSRDLKAADAGRDALRARCRVLERYARHSDSCRVNHGWMDCDCGLVAALAAAKGEDA